VSSYHLKDACWSCGLKNRLTWHADDINTSVPCCLHLNIITCTCSSSHLAMWKIGTKRGGIITTGWAHVQLNHELIQLVVRGGVWKRTGRGSTIITRCNKLHCCTEWRGWIIWVITELLVTRRPLNPLGSRCDSSWWKKIISRKKKEKIAPANYTAEVVCIDQILPKSTWLNRELIFK